MKKYEPKVTPWQINEQDFPRDEDSIEKSKFLLRYAILAPSSHNTQPWKFSIGEDGIRIFVDKTRWLKVADSDQRELHVSIGCALENLLIAAEHFGYAHQVTYFPEPSNEELAAVVRFTPREQTSAFRPTALFEAIIARHTNRQAYQARSIQPEDLQRLHDCCVEEGIQLHVTDDPEIKRRVDELMVHADALQFADPAWRDELGYWIGQGAFGMPWLVSKVAQLAVTYLNMGKGTAKKDSEVLMSAPLLAALSSQANDRATQVKAGQALERVWLMATNSGIRLHPMNQILQLPEIKAEVTKRIPMKGVMPQLTFRLGYAEPEKEHAPRRPLGEVLI